MQQGCLPLQHYLKARRRCESSPGIILYSPQSWPGLHIIAQTIRSQSGIPVQVVQLSQIDDSLEVTSRYGTWSTGESNMPRQIHLHNAGSPRHQDGNVNIERAEKSSGRKPTIRIKMAPAVIKEEGESQSVFDACNACLSSRAKAKLSVSTLTLTRPFVSHEAQGGGHSRIWLRYEAHQTLYITDAGSSTSEGPSQGGAIP